MKKNAIQQHKVFGHHKKRISQQSAFLCPNLKFISFRIKNEITMSHKTKSFLYFSSFILAVASYYTIGNTDTIQNTELAENTIEKVSAAQVLN